MSAKTEKTRPLTAKELKAAGLFKISAEIDLTLFQEFKAMVALRDTRIKAALEEAIKLYLYGDKAKSVDQKDKKK